MKMPKVLLFVFLILPIGAFAKSDYEKGNELFQAGKYKDALIFFEETILSHPDWFPAVLMRGRCNYQLGNFDKAIQDFNDVLTLEVPGNTIPAVKYYIARSYMSKKEYDKAIQGFTELVPLSPESRRFDVLINRAQSQLQNSQRLSGAQAKKYLSDARASYDEALKYPTKRQDLKIEAAFNRAYASFKVAEMENDLTKLAAARKDCEAVIDMKADERRAHDLLISIDFRLIEGAPESRRVARFRETIPHLNRYLSKWPDAYDMLEKKGKALQGAKDYPAAVDVFTQLVAKRPDGEAFYSLASCQMAAKRYKQAFPNFEKALGKGYTADPSLYKFAAYSLTQQKNKCYDNDIPLYEKAVGMLDRGIKALPSAQHALLQKDLKTNRDNLQIMQNNLATDNDNHAVAIENIRSLKGSIEANTDKLRENRERYIEQPTEELQAAIDEGQTAIEADNKSLDDEYKALRRYIRDAKKCGGAKLFTNLREMEALMASKDA